MTTIAKKIQVTDNTVVQEMGSGIVVLNLNTERFYELDEVGKRIWELLSDNKEYSTIVDILLSEYDVSEKQLQEDLNRLIEDLKKAELIEIC